MQDSEGGVGGLGEKEDLRWKQTLTFNALYLCEEGGGGGARTGAGRRVN